MIAELIVSAIALWGAGDEGPSMQLDEHRPPTWDFTHAELEAEGLGQGCAHVLPSDQLDAPRSVTANQSAVADRTEPTVLFLNFDGAMLISGPDDARSNVTTINKMAGDFPPFGDDGARRESVIQAVREDWSAYNTIITDERPQEGEYVMNMVGPSDALGGSILGVAVLDCGDERTRNNITFAFHGANDNDTAATIATTISQEIGHSFGLEHVNRPADIMNPFNTGGDPSFRDECIELSDEAECPEQHEAQCGNRNLQNAHEELYALVGPATPSSTSPSINIIAPLDGENFDVGESFDIVVVPDDGVVIRRAALFVNSSLQDTDEADPFGWTASEVSTGEYELRVEAQDAQGLIRASQTVTVTIGLATNQGEGAVLPGSFGSRGADQGCACAADGSPARGGWMWGLVLLAFVRPRRAR